jgi:hypothetical protein
VGQVFVGTALLYRLLAPDLALRRVYTIIRGENPISRLPADLHPVVATIDSDGKLTDARLVILAGDCALPGFGLSAEEHKWLEDVDIVINSAGSTMFTMPLPEAVRSIVSRISACPKMRTLTVFFCSVGPCVLHVPVQFREPQSSHTYTSLHLLHRLVPTLP